MDATWEPTGPHGEALGNFPQAFTHLSLIGAACNLDRVLGGRKIRVSGSGGLLPKSSRETYSPRDRRRNSGWTLNPM